MLSIESLLENYLRIQTEDSESNPFVGFTTASEVTLNLAYAPEDIPSVVEFPVKILFKDSSQTIIMTLTLEHMERKDIEQKTFYKIVYHVKQNEFLEDLLRSGLKEA